MAIGFLFKLSTITLYITETVFAYRLDDTGGTVLYERTGFHVFSKNVLLIC